MGLALYSKLALRRSANDQAHISNIGMRKFLLLVGKAFVYAARDGIALSNMEDLHFLSSTCGVLSLFPLVCEVM